MMDYQLRHQLAAVGRRLGRLWLWKRLTWCWLACIALAVVWAFTAPMLGVSFGWIPAVATIAAAYLWVCSTSLSLDKNEIAREVEHAFPELNSRLLAAMEQSPDMKTGRWNVLQRQLISEAVHHSRINDWNDTIPPKQMWRAFLRQAAAMGVFIITCCVVWPVAAERSAIANRGPSAVAPTGEFEQPVVEPGDTEVERGSSLLILARFAKQSPASVYLDWRTEISDSQLPLTKSLDDPIFAGRVGTVDRDMTYTIVFDSHRTREYKITVYDLPALVRSDLELHFPSYTEIETRKLEDAFVATVVEGTTIRIACRLNKSVAAAELVERDGAKVALRPDSSDPLLYRADFVPTGKHRMKLQLTDDGGRHNRDPEEFRFEAKPNQVPQITMTFPGRDIKVSPLEEVQIEATAWDDFGLIETGIVVTVPGRDPMTIPLGKNKIGGETHTLAMTQRLEELKVEPDELISYYVYADDFDPDGKQRRTSSDLYFAEVRPFEEIFRQMDAPAGGQSAGAQQQQNGNPMDKLLDLQKQIVAATWKLVRGNLKALDSKQADNVSVIRNSQKKAIEQLEPVKERLTAPQLQPSLSMIGDRMENAEQSLGQSVDDKSATPLNPALAAEQAAYQGLLKLRAKEHLMMKSQQSGGGSGGASSASAEQMQQLELTNKQNRYELQRSGQKQGDAAQQREELAVLDRLKELARRQQGVNDKLKELEAALRTAKTEAEKEELERQLKRLRDDQQQLLHDADEVRNRMTQSAQPEKMNEARQQLEQTRQQLVDTTEKLREGQLSQALNSGTRAERELNQIQEDFRKQTAAQFADAMRSMREDARQISEREQQLSEQLGALQDESKHSLRQSKNRQSLEAEFKEQRRNAAELVDEAKSLVEQAEQAEPLLAKQLYDTVRSTRESKTDQALDATAQLLRAGFLPEAQRAEEQARAGIQRLKEGIEKAAEAVLGDEVESLKRARGELAELSESLRREIAAQQAERETQQRSRIPGQARDQGQQGQGQQGQGQQGQGQQGQGQQGQGQQGQGQQGQGQQGQGQQGQGQQGQGQQGQGQQGQGQQGQGQQGQGQQGQGQQGQGQGQGEGASGDDASGANEGVAGGGSGRGRRGGLRGRGQGGSQPSPGNKDGGSDQGGLGGGPGGQGGPLTGNRFSEWNERLRDVESMVSDPKLQAEIAKVRERARSLRADFKRHSQSPNWELVRTSVHEPMIELQKQLAEEIARREKPDSLVPVDRDPVPTRYQGIVRSYYERLGRGQEKRD